jgi:hypothetical protein
MRPITEKVIEKAEALPGCRGWFSQMTAAPVPAGPFEELTADEKAFMENFRTLTDSDRRRIATEVAARAAELREYLAQHGSPAIPLVAPPRHAPAAKAKAAPAREHAKH